MYSLDINFLKDRSPEETGGGGGGRQPSQPINKIPILIGLGVAIVPLLGVGGFWLFVQKQTNDLTAEKDKLQTELTAQVKDQTELNSVIGETNQVKFETQSLANIFTQVKPWSALLEELRELTPEGIQLKSLQQTVVPNPNYTPVPTPAPAPAPTPTPTPAAGTPPAPPPPPISTIPQTTSQIDITGVARTYEEVNDFVLRIKRSRFFKKEQTVLMSADLSPMTIIRDDKQQKKSAIDFEVKVPDMVNFRIQTLVTDLPASELIKELEKNRADGLVTRLKVLQEKGVFKK